MFDWLKRSEIHEASSNFDLENVRPFLERVNERHGLRLDVEKLTRFTAETQIEDERAITSQCRFEGKDVGFTYQVFMDDIDAPDICFFSRNDKLIKMLSEEIERFCDELGI